MTGDEIYLLEDGVAVGLARQHIATRCNVFGYQTERSDKERQEVVVKEH